MDETEVAEAPEDESRIRHYADLLNPLFWHDEFNRVDRSFELVCTLVRTSGIKDTGWDSHLESINLLDDLGHRCQIELPSDRLIFPDNTRARLTLISYCHATEMNFPYELVANLLRLHLGLNYCMHPFGYLDRPITKKLNGVKIIDKIIAARRATVLGQTGCKGTRALGTSGVVDCSKAHEFKCDSVAQRWN
jgi:hypothetical protein